MAGRESAAAAALDAVEPLEVLSTILESAFSAKGALDADTLKTFGRTIEAARCYRLVYSNLEDAVRILVAAADE